MIERERRKELLWKERRRIERVVTNGEVGASRRAERLLKMLGHIAYYMDVGRECRATELRARRLLVVGRKRTLNKCVWFYAAFNFLSITLALIGKGSLTFYVGGHALFGLIIAEHLRMIAHHARLIREIKEPANKQGLPQVLDRA